MMAKSKARKSREKQIREGKWDVTLKRGSWGEFKPYNRQTKTKKEALHQMETKHQKKNHSHKDYDENGSFHFFSHYKPLYLTLLLAPHSERLHLHPSA
ncbi:hypothetical protein WQ54_10455 [Bacillus sp. SA1-12]|uniref:hypothetical protein n=1 Tax=Bacillus sp. SA1-12 TaxID=1455638 RepID=UPI0006257155|nr:hypothetical protein [Bacillus sp. SA1-12]KKI92235.1 hypothetical protein WQ54_10455 [Bacillus sp. SA1-12]